MSDGRGRGRGRGGQGQDQRGGRGGRGGGTGFQGVRGGRGGGGGGGDYQGGGRGGGEYRGGGRGGGEFRGGRGGGEYRGGRGGEFRGGRGGGRGGFGGPPAEVYRGMGATVPQPDADITRLEDEWMKRHGDLVSKMAKLSVSTTDFFPRRPHFGTEGDEVILWANYFTLNVKGDALFRYDLRVTPKKAAKAEGEGKPEQEKEVREAKGVKLATLIKSALAKLPGKFPVATEYKAHVVSPQRLQLPADATIEVTLPSSGGRREETWCVRFDGPNDMDISGCKAYLHNPADTGSDAAFPKFTDELDAFGVVLGHTARSDGNTSAVGRNRFFAFDQRRVDGVVPAQSLLHILRGYFQSVRPATGRLLLNVNVTHGVFRRSLPLAKLFDEFSIRDVNQDIKDLSTRKTLDRIQKFLSRSRIRCRVLPSGPGEKEQVIERTIAGLATVRDGQKPGKGERPPEFRYKSFPYPGPATARFYFRKPESGRAPPTGLQYETMVTVADYYKHKYGCIALGYPLINVGTSGRPIYVLAEHCELLPGQPIKTKLSAGEQDAMVRFACRKPGENATSITTSAREVLALDNNPLLGKFGITVDKELITVKGRELRAPAVDYAQGKSTSPREGGWNMMGMKVFKPGRPIKSWTFLHIQQRGREFGSDTVKEAVSAFAESMQRNMGINISGNPNPPNGIRAVIAHEDDPALKGFFRQLQGVKPDFVLVVLPQKSTALYNMVKKFADVEFGLTTVCVVQDKFTKRRGPSFDPGYFANVGLKVNLKFGGVNHQVKDPSGLISGGKTMFVGYDVTHPTNLGPGAAENAPSLVGLVASVDSHLGQWPAVAWQNPSRAEMVDNTGGKFVGHFKDRLRLWQQKNQGRLPLNIVIFRDGVSEGQFKKVLDEELPHMRTACQQIYTGGTQPRLSLIVSVKRHHTRFFPTDPQHMTKSGSPKDGTVVDRGVTNVRYWDFYLQAHTAIQGTARPAHYTVLLDEIFRADYGAKAANVLEKLTHNMCYLFGRATRAVSICPPAYYADLVCTRGRVHQSELFDDVSSMTSGDQSAILGRTVHENLKNTMYYM